MKIPQTMKTFFQAISKHFPPTQFAFAYGSAAFKQPGQDPRKNMLDFIFSVENSLTWHKKNLENNPNHYSSLRHFGPSFLSKVQNNFGAGIYYNTLIPFQGRLIKYGVIETSRLCQDLLDWDSLYVSGRLHKPVHIMDESCFFSYPDPSKTLIKHAYFSNLESAVRVALLLLPSKFTQTQLYETLTSLSYQGDFRMKFGENPRKVQNIVQGNSEGFSALYQPILLHQEFQNIVSQISPTNTTNPTFQQNDHPHIKYQLFTKLPKNLALHFKSKINSLSSASSQSKTNHLLYSNFFSENAPHTKSLLEASLSTIVASSSQSQSLKGLFSAGLLKSFQYSLKKLGKMTQSQT